jgi:hypothetical protein
VGHTQPGCLAALEAALCQLSFHPSVLMFKITDVQRTLMFQTIDGQKQ